VLAENPVLLVGDSTSEGLYNELSRGVLTNYKFGNKGKGRRRRIPKGLAFIRSDIGSAEEGVRILKVLRRRRPKVLIWNWGAHEAIEERFHCPLSKMFSSQLYNLPHWNDGDQEIDTITEFKPGTGCWKQAREETMAAANARCREDCRAAAIGDFAR
jgi:hypothetical protein